MQGSDAVRWLQLTYKVPSEPSQKRVWVWRRLQNLGAYALQNSVYLLPFTDDVEKHFRQLVQDIHEMGGDASIFSVVALDLADERRMLQILQDARNNEYNTVVNVCGLFLAKASTLVEAQNWHEQAQHELAEVLEKVHALFRTAKRHDLLGALTATRRAEAAESLAICEQVFRVLIDKEYTKARRLLEMHSELFCHLGETDPSSVSALLIAGQGNQHEHDDGQGAEPSGIL